MKLSCTRDKLKSAVGNVDKVTGRNLSLPALAGIYLEAVDKQLILKATNLDVGVEVEIPARVSAPGVVLIPGHLLSGLISGMEGETVDLELTEAGLHVSSGKSSSVVRVLSVDDFPIIPKVSPDEGFEVDARDLIAGFRSVTYAASLSDMKPEISSVYVYGEGETLYFVATDSFRLAEKKITVPSDSPFSPIMVPHKNVTEIVRMFADQTGPVQMLMTKNQLGISGQGVYFTSRLVSGSFPNYRQIVPNAKKTTATVSKKDFSQALKISGVFADKVHQVSVTVTPEDTLCEIRTKNDSLGEQVTLLDGNLEGESITLAFNARYMLEALPYIETDMLTLSFNGLGRPMVITGSGDSSFLYLVMPMNK